MTTLFLTCKSPYLEKTVFVLRRGPGSNFPAQCPDNVQRLSWNLIFMDVQPLCQNMAMVLLAVPLSLKSYDTLGFVVFSVVCLAFHIPCGICIHSIWNMTSCVYLRLYSFYSNHSLRELKRVSMKGYLIYQGFIYIDTINMTTKCLWND